MVDLVAVGTGERERQTLAVPMGESLRIGRALDNAFAVPWDRQISRQHADLSWQDDQLVIRCLKQASNPLVVDGKPVREAFLGPGACFRIGQTQFEVIPGATPDEAAEPVEEELVDVDPDGEEFSYRQEDLAGVAFKNSSKQLELLAGLPRLITSEQTDADLGEAVARLLLEAIPNADAVAVCHYEEDEIPRLTSWTNGVGQPPKPAMMRVETRDDYTGRFRPSRRLLGKSLTTGESVIHIWADSDTVSADEAGQFTMSDSLNWAFCAPVSDQTCKGWCLYVAGGDDAEDQFVTENDLTGDLRFVELLAQFLGSVRRVRTLEEHKTQLSSFFSPKVVENLTSKGSDTSLVPAERQVSVLFCDVRGFSRKSEELSDDLLQLLTRVRRALGVMAGGILEKDGAIADFQGDAALGFWGWPIELEEGPLPACRAALTIVNEFKQSIRHEGLLDGFSVGIGVAHGRAVAGQIGTNRQAKVGVFGPVVNQGARLESMTKQLGITICIDEPTAEYARLLIKPDEGRVRKLARVRPKGMDTPITVSELMPSADTAGALNEDQHKAYESAVDLVIAGDWVGANALMETIPETDGPKQFLLAQMARFDNAPPADWDGAFSLAAK